MTWRAWTVGKGDGNASRFDGQKNEKELLQQSCQANQPESFSQKYSRYNAHAVLSVSAVWTPINSSSSFKLQCRYMVICHVPFRLDCLQSVKKIWLDQKYASFDDSSIRMV
eukprot:IDg21995t1